MRIVNMTIAEKVEAFNSLLNRNSDVFNRVFKNTPIEGNYDKITINDIHSINGTVNRYVEADGDILLFNFSALKGRELYADYRHKHKNRNRMLIKYIITHTCNGVETKPLTLTEAAEYINRAESSVRSYALGRNKPPKGYEIRKAPLQL